MASLFPRLLGRQLKHNLQEEGGLSVKLRVGWSLLLWLLALLSVFVITALYSPRPFRVSPLIPYDGLDSGHPETAPVNGDGSDKGHLETATPVKVETRNQTQRLCDPGKGRWVRDPTVLAYTHCPSMPESKNCAKFGKDMDYTNWRWRPNDCELPTFDPRAFLDRVRGKTMKFVGDSVARNQFDSLVCLLSQVENPKSIYQDQDDRFRTWHFSSVNFTLAIFWTRFLVLASEQLKNGSATGAFDLHLEKIDPSWANTLTEQTDFLVISTGHWFFRKLYIFDNSALIGCIFCSEPNVTNINIPNAVQKVFRKALEFILNSGTSEGITTFVRTFSPAHFENGTWNNGGQCNRTQPLKEEETDVSGTYWDISRLQLEEVSRVREQSPSRKLNVVPLDITRAMLMRADGHPDSHWNNKWANGYSDCVHWCLPGPIDMWNHLLSAAMDGLTYSL